MRYRWEIRTGDTWYAATDASVTMALTGDKGSMKEMELNDPDSNNDWEKGDVNSGAIETDDLGEIQTGTLRHDNSGALSGWYVDWVKITNEEDGREWTAQVGKWDDGGRYPLLRFSRTNDGQYELMQRQKAQRAAQEAAKAAEAARKAADTKAAAEQADIDAALDRELANAKLEADRAKKRAEIDKLKGGAATTTTTGPTPVTGFRTYELYGSLNGATVPLSSVVSNGRVVPGGRVMVGEAPNDGFGLGGSPGRWREFYPSTPPESLGLPPGVGILVFDGVRGHALDPATLQRLLGPDWRSQFTE